MIQQSEEEKSASDHLRHNQPHEPFTFDQVKMLWRSYAFKLKEEGLETFYNALIKREPIVQDEVIFTILVDNQVQVTYIENRLPEMVDLFRRELKNYSIDIKLEMADQKEEDKKPQTGKEKFAVLARKNPNLHTLKNTFNLDIEF